MAYRYEEYPFYTYDIKDLQVQALRLIVWTTAQTQSVGEQENEYLLKDHSQNSMDC